MDAKELKWRSSALTAAAALRAGPIAASLFAAILVRDNGQYADIVILTVFTPLMTVLGSQGLDHAYFRIWASTEGPVSRRDLSHGFVRSLAFAPVAIGVGLLIAQWLPGDSGAMATAGGVASLQSGTILILQAEQRARRAGAQYLAMALLSSILPFSTRIILLCGGFDISWSWVSGDVVATLVGGALWLRWYWNSDVSARPVHTRAETQYGWHVTWHGLWGWGLGSSDRVIFGLVVSQAQLALYGVSYQLGGAFNALSSEIAKSGLHRYARQADPGRAMKRDIVVLSASWTAMLPLVLAASVLMQSTHYRGLVPLSLAIYGSLLPLICYLPLVAKVAISEGNSASLNVSSCLGCVSNVCANAILVRELGLYAGPIANVLGFSVMVLSLYMASAKTRGTRKELANSGEGVGR